MLRSHRASTLSPLARRRATRRGGRPENAEPDPPISLEKMGNSSGVPASEEARPAAVASRPRHLPVLLAGAFVAARRIGRTEARIVAGKPERSARRAAVVYL